MYNYQMWILHLDYILESVTTGSRAYHDWKICSVGTIIISSAHYVMNLIGFMNIQSSLKIYYWLTGFLLKDIDWL